ncbi:cyclic nucleotide-binding domain-containing protein [Nocardiopsis synnemataformans]|uniref:cyclic nucleotide-binding domain-containing protein n=1 Tax=Nocardiopsis synnemataformans TaxID=61305 RepID=UPI003EBD8789
MTTKAEHWCLSETALFQNLGQGEMEEVNARTPPRPVRAGQLVRAPHQELEALYVVKYGRVRLYRIGEDGRTVTTAIVGSGALFGEITLPGLIMAEGLRLAAQTFTRDVAKLIRRVS